MNVIQTQKTVTVSAINAFSDNYIWCIQAHQKNYAALIDPGDADVCIDYLTEHNLQLSTIYITHRHNDHVGGVNQLVDYCKANDWPLKIYGPAKEAQKFSDIQVVDGDIINDEHLGVQCRVLDVPGHTLGHIAYLIEDNLFCGDTLFSAGCGRVFDGTAEQLFNSLSTLSALPAKTQVYCAHEYTMANLAFALMVDPTNEELINYYNNVKDMRANYQRSIPTSIAVETKINPFLRCFDSNIQHSVETFCNTKLTSPLAVFTQLRQWKNEC